MDFKTKPVSIIELRVYFKVFRTVFGVSDTGAFPVLEALERLPDVFENSNYEIVEDCKLPKKTMARCFLNQNSGYTIQIKQSVYDGACKDGYCKDLYRGFIIHEIAHVFMFSLGYTPIFERSFEDNTLPPYCSVEWQAKALSLEIMVPYTESEGMSREEIIKKYHVSKSFAYYRTNKR